MEKTQNKLRHHFDRVLPPASQGIALLFAGLLYAAALKYFVFPAKVVLTGTEGIAVSLAYYFEQESIFLWLYIVFQTALITFGFLKVGKSFAFRSLCVVGTVVVMLPLLPFYEFAQPESHNERILLVLFGGILAGAAKAIAFRNGGSTADEDILAAYFAVRLRKQVGAIAIIAGVVSTAFGMATALLKTGELEPVVNTLMYTCIYIFISAETLNNFFHKFKLTLINVITRKPDEVGKSLKDALHHRTFTIKDGMGGHSKERFSVLQTVVTQEELELALEVIKKSDSTCFYFHQEINGVSSNFYISPIK